MTDVPIPRYGDLQRVLSFSLLSAGSAVIALIATSRQLTGIDWVAFVAFPAVVAALSLRVGARVSGAHLHVQTHFRNRSFDLRDIRLDVHTYFGAWSGGVDAGIVGLHQLSGADESTGRGIYLMSSLATRRAAERMASVIQSLTEQVVETPAGGRAT